MSETISLRLNVTNPKFTVKFVITYTFRANM